ncbi:MAG TPA: hypothetical protein VNZ22_00795, partial [Bacillota bacterium]|nr:hypothetical protein [Bacillota bacterium]
GLQSAFGLNPQPSPLTSQLLARLLPALFRFAKYEELLAHLLRAALVPLSIEHDCSGDYLGPKNKAILAQASPSPSPVSKATQGDSHSSLTSQLSTLNSLFERSLLRWCDWLDALVHYQTHAQWHWNPVCFDPDPDRRQLAILGALQRHLADLSAPAQAVWQQDFAAAAARFKGSPKWPMLGRAMSADSDRLWLYREVDTLVISLWPLVRQHNWTYRDLLNTIRPALGRPKGYPCERDQDFATYCNHVLGLRKPGKGVTAKDGRPAGYEVARRLCALSAPEK